LENVGKIGKINRGRLRVRYGESVLWRTASLRFRGLSLCGVIGFN